MEFIIKNLCIIVLSLLFAPKCLGTVQDEFYAIYDGPGDGRDQMRSIEKWYSHKPDGRKLLCKCLIAMESDLDLSQVYGLPMNEHGFSIKDKYRKIRVPIIACGSSNRAYYYSFTDDIHDYFAMKRVHYSYKITLYFVRSFAKVSIPRKEEVDIRNDEELGQGAGHMDDISEYCSQLGKLLLDDYNRYSLDGHSKY